ncbi:MAG: hypothetical protein DIZ80_04795 [endosymbiont of Galathealinum brachiosum]|uniref:Uncharacterized protein n=1 Tax=endosymbiont of Galathealinum brachiosum TaxID=2200906 RepID=A0A370DKE6_9GAMM|nr:MAG: hypothetical protein DIZ80_04795 [endosymbiont of Galathealinum brachiosum]
MQGSIFRRTIQFTTLFIAFIYSQLSLAGTNSKHLSVISSANPDSNAVHSFIIIKEGQLLTQGIKHSSKQNPIGHQTPFVIKLIKKPDDNHSIQWSIKVNDKQHGTIKLLSEFNGNGRMLNSGYLWKSSTLDKTIQNRQQLIFRPAPFAHQPSIYKKGKGPQGNRRKYGGGTRNIDEKKYNPKFSYDVIVSITEKGKKIATHKTNLSMDRIDMIRQEYINHYDIKRYGRGENGHIPIPKRDEITNIPEKPEKLEGNPLTESRYKLIINDGMLDLADKITTAYTQSLKELKSSSSFQDLKNNRLEIPDNKLWVTSGWRNPERNEWYSNAVNGIHQRGGAIDLIIMAPSNSRQSSIGYWILWNALEKNKSNINAYWQLETNGRPMTTKEFKQDIEPQNGIPDAFDKADHLHANVKY